MLSNGEMQSYLGAIGGFGGLAQDAANGLDAIEQMIANWSNNSQQDSNEFLHSLKMLFRITTKYTRVCADCHG